MLFSWGPTCFVPSNSWICRIVKYILAFHRNITNELHAPWPKQWNQTRKAWFISVNQVRGNIISHQTSSTIDTHTKNRSPPSPHRTGFSRINHYITNASWIVVPAAAATTTTTTTTGPKPLVEARTSKYCGRMAAAAILRAHSNWSTHSHHYHYREKAEYAGRHWPITIIVSITTKMATIITTTIISCLCIDRIIYSSLHWVETKLWWQQQQQHHPRRLRHRGGRCSYSSSYSSRCNSSKFC